MEASSTAHQTGAGDHLSVVGANLNRRGRGTIGTPGPELQQPVRRRRTGSTHICHSPPNGSSKASGGRVSGRSREELGGRRYLASNQDPQAKTANTVPRPKGPASISTTDRRRARSWHHARRAAVITAIIRSQNENQLAIAAASNASMIAFHTATAQALASKAGDKDSKLTAMKKRILQVRSIEKRGESN
jgi:hypothetical protein